MITLIVNGKTAVTEAGRDTPLLYVLRNDLGLNGPKFGCGLAQCGACMILMDGSAVASCVTPAGKAEGKVITTLEGLGTLDNPHPLQKAFIEEQAAQCGFCMNGMIIRSKALLDRVPDPTDEQIRIALSPNLCRCGTHRNIIRAVRRATREMRR